MTASTDCIICPAQTITATEGSSACTSCGGTSRSNAGDTSCSCIGNNRKYLVNSQMCVCLDGYESATAGNEQVDSEEDCSKRLIPSGCSATDRSGSTCVSQDNSCYDECGANGGVRYMTMCQCNEMTLRKDACSDDCIDNVYYYVYGADGYFNVYNSSDQIVASYDVSTWTGISGTFDYNADDSNEIYSIGLSGSTFTANYECSSGLSTLATD